MEQKISSDKATQIPHVLFQMFYSTEELKTVHEEIEILDKKLAELISSAPLSM